MVIYLGYQYLNYYYSYSSYFSLINLDKDWIITKADVDYCYCCDHCLILKDIINSINKGCY